MDTTAFYTAASALCFTLLGFWWVVVQFRHEELTGDAASRRFMFLVSLHFIVPGLVSLASLLAIGAGGALSSMQTTVLLSVEDTLAALQKAGSVKYRPPGATG